MLKQAHKVGDSDVYTFPIDKQIISKNYIELAKNSIVQGVMKSIKKTDQFRNFTVTLNEELKKLYVDNEGNFCFNSEYLEEIASPSCLDQYTLTHIESTRKKTLQSVTKDMVIWKFDGKNFNASNWIRTHELECTRMEIPKNRYCEVIRLFIEGPMNDWYTATRTLIGSSN